jgi:AhpD family alkylhydroperoxidase
MTERISYQEAPKGLMDGLMKAEGYLKRSTVDHKIAELVKYRVSQINGCAYCLDMHHKEAIHLGESQLRLHSIAAWRDAPYYSDKEKAALNFAEALTNIGSRPVEDKVIDELSAHFSKADIANLTLVVTQINAWNRINRVFGTTPGNYQIGQFEN